ncbi:MAG: glycine zipper 2TM domain-containing protein [Gammaproteobacteria bacterium]|nr:MAG: glycine zipper 2TM domain-containing protein [Gammaproteobacteria bacterium]
MKTRSSLLVGLAGLALTTGAWAQVLPGESRYVYAPVVSVDPIVHVVQVPDRRQECWDEQVTYADGGGGSPGATIIGGILGAALGNQVGGGSGRTIATAAGAVVGAVIGNQATRRPPRVYNTVETRCREVVDQFTEQRIVGYNVAYEWQGEIYTTRMSHDPGDQVRLRVTVSPVN